MEIWNPQLDADEVFSSWKSGETFCEEMYPVQCQAKIKHPDIEQ